MAMTRSQRPYVLIIGGGKVGFYLAKHLIERGYEVTLCEKNASRAEWITHQLGTVSIMVGDGDEMASQNPVWWELLRSVGEKRELGNDAILYCSARESETLYLV